MLAPGGALRMVTIVGYGWADWILYRLAPLWRVMILAEGRGQNKH